MSARRRPPAGLGESGRAFWRSVVAVYDLAPAEFVMLAQACAVTDLLARADAELAAADLTVFGSAGQPKAHPLIAATADLRRVLDVLIRGLALPMPGETVGQRRSPVAMAAAQARWRGQHGEMA
jgi:phage terminase small subunit